MRKQLSLFFFFVGITSFFFLSFTPVLAQATKSFEVTITDIRAVHGKVEGILRITNPNALSYENVSYTEQLLGADIVETRVINGQIVPVISTGPLMSYKTSPPFRIAPKQRVDFPISLPYSTAVVSGAYKLQVAVSDTNNKLLGITKQPVELKGTSSFVTLADCLIVAGGEEYTATIGPNVEPNAPVYGTCKVTNPSTTALVVYPRSTYAINEVVGYPESEKKTVSSETGTTIPAGATKTVRFPLPSLEKPQVYEALSSLEDGQDVQVSSQVAFRWVIAGPSATIRSIIIDKVSYGSAEIAKVTVAADPSMDLYWRAGGPQIMTFPPTAKQPPPPTKLNGTPLVDPKLFVTVTDKDGVICGEKEQKVTAPKDVPSWPDQVVSVAIDKDCPGAQGAAVVKNGDTVLAEKSSAGASSSIASEPSGTKNSILVIIVVLLVLVAGGAAAFWYWKKKKAAITANIIFIIFITLITFIWTPVAAAAPLEVKPGQQGISIDYLGLRLPKVACHPAYTQNGWSSTPTGSGYCAIYNPHARDMATFDLLDTQDQIAFSGDSIKARVAGRLSGVGCVNTRAGLIIRAYVDGTNVGVKINGGSNKLIVADIVNFAGGSGSKDVDMDLTITPGVTLACGQHKVKLEIIPFVIHGYQASSDPAEDPGVQDGVDGGVVLFENRKNCGGSEPCWGVLEKTIKKPCACNDPCTQPADCEGAQNGCTVCTPGAAGAKTCQPPPPPACGALCQRDDQCAGAKDGCVWCATTGANAGKCIKPVACNTACTTKADCAATRDSCTECLPNDTGTGSSCKPVAACGTACTKDSQCAGARDGCTMCTAGKCSAFSENMCSCDGMDFQAVGGGSTFFPGSDVTFIAYAKVPGKDWKGSPEGAVKSAEVKGMKFALYQSKLTNPDTEVLKLAESALIVPEVVQNDATMVRYKVTWNQKIPATVPAGSLFRVIATIPSNGGCVKKPGVLGASTSQTSNYYTDILQNVLGVTEREQQQAESFYPGAKILEKSCTVIKFFFE